MIDIDEVSTIPRSLHVPLISTGPLTSMTTGYPDSAGQPCSAGTVSGLGRGLQNDTAGAGAIVCTIQSYGDDHGWLQNVPLLPAHGTDDQKINWMEKMASKSGI